MKNLFLALESGSMEQQRKKKTVAYAIIITTVALIISLIVFLISGIVSLFGGDGKKDEGKKNDLFETVTTTFSEKEKNNGTLLLLDDNHPYRGDAGIILFRDAKDRPKTSDGKYNIYTIGGTAILGATTETVSAFNQMMADFYADASSGKDDNIYIDKACNITSTSQSELFASGLCLALTYYQNYDVNHENRPSIYGVEKYKWIYDNAHKYGFIQLYSASSDGSSVADANIFRYVGVPHATYMKKQGLGFEQYLEALRATSPANPLSVMTADGEKYIYYIAADGAQLIPKNHTYSVSGDNSGGYIITVNADTTIS